MCKFSTCCRTVFNRKALINSGMDAKFDKSGLKNILPKENYKQFVYVCRHWTERDRSCGN